MEKEISSRIFLIEDYKDKDIFDKDITQYIEKLKKDYPTAIITKEFYKGNNIMVRVTEISNKNIVKHKDSIKENVKEDDWYIRQRGER